MHGCINIKLQKRKKLLLFLRVGIFHFIRKMSVILGLKTGKISGSPSNIFNTSLLPHKGVRILQ